MENIFKFGETSDGEIDLFTKAIEEMKNTNKVEVNFTKKVNALVDKYNECNEQDVLRDEVIGNCSDKIINLYYELHAEMDSFGEVGIDFEEKAFYDIILMLVHKYDFIYLEDRLLELSRAVK
ncbi:type I restriction enzyme endonuclease domain-containing protein [Psychrobacter sp. GP33]|uniref:type I restriction enzyme endonuclease domain-containing protein n=1 Tax=Psychrobacter sp. GP33 TaxID=2758709 RepID=UPI001C715A8F|nr:type I restriction enzyme endonuclease domain-containing protein [Psychrobacter sp. GP33]